MKLRNLILSIVTLGVTAAAAAADPMITDIKISDSSSKGLTAEGWGGGGGSLTAGDIGAVQGGLIGTGLGTYFGGPLGGYIGGVIGEQVGRVGYPAQIEAAEEHFRITGESIVKAGNKQ